MARPRPFKFYFILIVLTILVSLTTAKIFSMPGTTKPVVAEPVYERVLKTKTIRCGFATWAPYMIKDANTGKLSGFDYEYMEQLGKILDLKIQWTEEVGWGNYIEGLNNHRYDMLCSTDWAIGERLKYSTISTAASYSSLYAFVRTGDHRFDGDLKKINQKDIKIAAIDGDSSYNVVRLYFPDAKIHAIDQMSEGAQLLLEVTTGKADVTIVDENIAKQFVKNNPGKIIRVADVPSVQTFAEVFVMKKGERSLKDMIDGGIEIINNSGFNDELKKKYQVDLGLPIKTFRE